MSSGIKELIDRTDLWALGHHLHALKEGLEVYSFDQTEQMVRKLAVQMQERMSADLLSSIKVVVVPRGGLFVAGQLAYALNFRQDQFVDDGRSPICIVDDCCLTGKRFGETLSRFDKREVWFCHLASAPEVRSAILNREPQVKAVISVVDLPLRHDSADQIVDESRYLNRSVAHVAFPWTEPGLPVVLPMSGLVEDGWRLMPPHATLGNLASLNLPINDTVQTYDIQAAETVVWRLDGDAVVMFETTEQAVIELSGLAAQVWKGCAGYRNCEAVLSFLQAESAKNVKKMICKLVAKNLLVQI